jgi:hypothetical protein
VHVSHKRKTRKAPQPSSSQHRAIDVRFRLEAGGKVRLNQKTAIDIDHVDAFIDRMAAVLDKAVGGGQQ